MGGWMGDHDQVCSFLKIIYNLSWWVVVDMSYTLDLILLFQIGIIELFQLVSI